MTRNLPQLNNQDGFFMVMALLIMATLAVAGLVVTNDAVMEGRVGRNFAIHVQCQNSAEAAGKEFIQAIDSIFETAPSAPQAVGRLNNQAWFPFDDYNTTFDFDEESMRDGTYSTRLKTSNLMGAVGYLDATDPTGAIAVLVNQTTSAMTPGLGGTKVPEYYTYVIYCRSVHAGTGNSESILVIGYRQEKV